MKEVLILGAGRSASTLINFMLENAEKHEWHVTVADIDDGVASEKVAGYKLGQAVRFDIQSDSIEDILNGKNLVISMLPARFHVEVARVCARMGINMITASYVSPGIRTLNQEFESNQAALIMEMGLDPGIDHMSAMHVLDQIKENGHELLSFETFTGGLLAPSGEDNPWGYKFTWNPRNVVMAGQGNVQFIQEGKYKYIPYQKLFQRTEIIHIPEYGYFEGYANRDSLKYLDAYQLKNIRTLYRGTLRRPGFCKAWNVFVQLGATDDSFEMKNVSAMTHREFINSFLSYNPNDSIELKLAHYMNLELDSEIMYKLKWLGVFSEELVGLSKGTPAQILEHILKKKWTMAADDKDMIVMWHKFQYLKNGAKKEIQSHMVIEGTDATNTAMSKTVGLPLAVTAKLLLTDKLHVTGVKIPTEKIIYEPVLSELQSYGINFAEREVDIAKPQNTTT